MRVNVAPPDLSRGSSRRSLRSRQSSAHSSATVSTLGEESVVRLLCHIDETWFRLHYFACTEAPTVLSATLGGAGVPRYSEWMQRAVGATMSSAWVGGVTGGRKRLGGWLCHTRSATASHPPRPEICNLT